MSKDMANETITLLDLYARVQKICLGACPPQVAVVDGRFQLAIECVDQAHCATWKWATDASMPAIESLILAACVRWLADNGHQPLYCREGEPKKYTIWVRYGIDFARPLSDDNPTIAALLAVETVCKECRK